MTEILYALGGLVVGSALTLAIATRLERARRQELFRTAAIEKRLAVHQQAYRLRQELAASLEQGQEQTRECIQRCQDWWLDNSLYLEKETRNAFYRAFNGAMEFFAVGGSRRNEKKIRDRIENLSRYIERAVCLPALSGRNEEKDLARQGKPETAAKQVQP